LEEALLPPPSPPLIFFVTSALYGEDELSDADAPSEDEDESLDPESLELGSFAFRAPLP
jgi:hypothetical protein